MSLGGILYTVLIKPLEMIFELIFAVSYDIIPNPAVNIVIMSLAFNLLVLPLYRRADVIQQQTRKRTEELTPMIDHIKKHFKGDERIMILQAFYRVENYSPLSSLKGMISLVLQIPFFIAAYQFLSQLTLLQGQGIGPVKDLSQPDGILTIGAVTINLLPVLMTVINIISSEVYTKGQKFKDKIVLYITALVFLVLLYNSPSGLVFYWTLNNVFSLVKNIVYKFIEPKESKNKEEPRSQKQTHENLIALFGLVYMSFLTGILIPSQVTSSGAEDFLDSLYANSPNYYVFYTLLIALGVFVVWCGIFYLISGKKLRSIFSYVILGLSITSTVNYLCFGIDGFRNGMLSSELVYVVWMSPDAMTNVLTTVSCLIIMVFAYLLFRYLKKVSSVLLVAGIISILVIGIMNCAQTESKYKEFLKIVDYSNTPKIELSKEGKNVVVLMMDRAISGLVPYIFNERPELVDSFDGFVYYPNTISHGIATNFGSPELYGGYEYTTEAMNSRDDQLLQDKQNEALKLLPVLFSDAGYEAVTIDPPYGNYKKISDLSIFDEYEHIHAYRADGMYNPYGEVAFESSKKVRERNFFYFSLFKISLSAFKSFIYDDGDYHTLADEQDKTSDGAYQFPQKCQNMSTSYGVNQTFMNAYTALSEMVSWTSITDDDQNNFMIMDNMTTHSFMMLTEPDYSVANYVDNSEYDKNHMDRFTLGNDKIHVEDALQMQLYHVNMRAYLSLAKWLDYLKENGVWDNTRIIVVSDHGYMGGHFDDLQLDELGFDAEYVNPVLMVKDFNSHGFKTSDEFMTNADTPTIALNGIVDNPVNPFTGNPVNDQAKFDGPQKILESYIWWPSVNNGTRFEPGRWYSVHDNIFDKNNWEYLGEY